MSLFICGIFYTLFHRSLFNFSSHFSPFILTLKVRVVGFRVASLFGKKVAARCDFSKVTTSLDFILGTF